MASTIRIKRSTVSGNPATLAAGELAYSGLTDNGSNGGDRLYIGLGAEFGGNAANHYVIGGKYFTDMMDHTRGTLTANSAILLDADKKINEFFVNNLKLTTNTISSTDTNGNIELDPNGSGNVIVKTGAALIVDDLTPTRLVFVGANSELTDTGNLTFSTSTGVLSLTGQLNVDSVSINDSTISTLVTDSNLVLNPNGAGLVSIANAYTLPRVDGTAGYALITDGNGTVTWQAAGSLLNLSGDNATTGTVNLITASLALNGSTGLDIAVSGTHVNFTLDIADANTLGIASFNSTDFTVTTGAVTLNTERVQDIVGAMIDSNSENNISVTYDDTDGKLDFSVSTATSSVLGVASFSPTYFTVTSGDVSINDATTSTKGISSFNAANFTVASGQVTAKDITLGTSTVAPGSTLSSIDGLNQITVDNIRIDGNTISALNSNGNVSLQSNGTGTVTVNNTRITDLAEPVADNDAATKIYVDNKVTGLTWKHAANVLSNTQTSLTGSWPYSIDNHVISNGYRVLLINQTDTSEHGIYTVTTGTGAYSLARSDDANVYGEIIGAAIFIEEGDLYANTGWLQSNHYLSDFTNQEWVQFSGAGAYSAGAGLTVDGTTFSVNVASTGGIEIYSDNLQLKSSVAGNGLTYTDGVVNAVGTSDRITVSADAIDISSTYAGQTSITTVGTLTNGVWNGTAINPAHGGTGQTTFNTGDLLVGTTGSIAVLAIGLPGQVLMVNSAGNGLEYADLDGGTY